MNYSVRDKNGKALGSFDLRTLASMIREKRLDGDDEYMGTNKAWQKLKSLEELGSAFAITAGAAKQGGEDSISGVPQNLASMFDGLDDSTGAQPDFTLSGSPPGVAAAQNSGNSGGPKIGGADVGLSLELDSPPAASPPPAGSIDQLWADDNGNMLGGNNLEGSSSTMMGAPPMPAADSTLMGQSPLLKPPTSKPPPPMPPPAASPNDLNKAISLDANALFDDKPKKALSSESSEADPLTDLLQDNSADPSASAPPPAKQDDLEDLFTSSLGKDPPSPQKNDGLDSLLGSTPDAFAGDLTMPVGDAFKAPAPAPAKPTPPPQTSRVEVDAPIRNKPVASPKLPVSEAKIKAEKSKNLGGLAEKLSGAVSEMIANVKEQVETKLRSLMYTGIGLLVLVGLAVGYHYFTKGKSAKSGAGQTASGEGPKGPIITTESLDAAQQLLSRDNYGAYLQAAQIYQNAIEQDVGDTPVNQAKQLEALARSQIRVKLEKPVQTRMEPLATQLGSAAEASSDVLRSLGAFELAKGNFDAALSRLQGALQISPQDTVTLSLIGCSHLGKGDFVEAEKFFNQSLQIYPANLTALYGLARISQAKDDSAAWELRLKKVLELSPGHMGSRVDLGIFFFKQNNLPEAEKNLVLVTGSQGRDASGPELAKAHYYIGLVLKNQGKLADSGAEFQKAAEADASDSKILLELGLYHLQQNKLEDAKNRFMAAIQLDKNADAIVGYATVLKQEKKFGDALLWLQQAIRSDPNHANAYLQLGLVNKELGDLEKAVSNIRQSQTLGKDNLEATLALAEIFAGLGKPDLAINEYLRAVTISPNNAQIHLALGKLYQQKGRYDSAAKEIKSAIEFTQDIKERGLLYYELGRVYLADNQFDEAIESEKMATRFVTNYVEAMLVLGQAHFKKGAYGEAQEVLEQARELGPQGDVAVEIYYTLANALRETASFEKAVQYYQKVLDARPDDFTVHYHLGLLYMKQSTYPKAVSEFEIAYPKLTDPDEKYNALMAMGQCFVEINQSSKAEGIYLKAMKEFPRRSEAYFRLGQIYDDQQQVRRAMGLYEKAAQLNPQDDRPYFYLGFAFKALNSPKQALQNFRKALALSKDPKRTEQIKDEIELLVRNP